MIAACHFMEMTWVAYLVVKKFPFVKSAHKDSILSVQSARITTSLQMGYADKRDVIRGSIKTQHQTLAKAVKLNFQAVFPVLPRFAMNVEMKED